MTDIVERLRSYALNCGGPPEEYLTWQAADEIERLRAALNPFAEIARRLGWDKLDENDMTLGDHLIEAPADDIAPGAVYCLMIGAFRHAALLDVQKVKDGSG